MRHEGLVRTADAENIQLIPSELESISQMDNPVQQIFALRNFASPFHIPREGGERVQARRAASLASFAADPTSSASLAVRIEALNGAVKNGFDTTVWGEDIGHSMREHANRLSYPISPVTGFGQYNHWRYGYSALLDEEDIPREIAWGSEQDKYDYGDPDAFQDYFPFPALLFLDELRQTKAHNQPTSEAAAAFMPLLEAVTAKIYKLPGVQPQPIEDWAAITDIIPLTQFGDVNRRKIIDLLNSNANTRQYIGVFAELSTQSSGLARVFPQEYSAAVKNGFQSLIADAFFAVVAHEENGGYTDVCLPLTGRQDVLKLHLRKDEPYILLNYLLAACSQLESLGRPMLMSPETSSEYSSAALVTKVSEADGYGIYRLFSKYGAKPITASLYIRPYGAASYDPTFEYGRNGEGVEASISYVIDPYQPEGELLEVGKHRRSGPDKRISIRLDREGVLPQQRGLPGVHRDPTQEQGTLSLDVGSVLGDDDWHSTKLGRFLAWGNMLRTSAEGTTTQLNHSTQFFGSTDGQATMFARRAEELMKAMEAVRVDHSEVKGLFAGKLALDEAIKA